MFCVKNDMLVEIDWKENTSKIMKMRFSKQIDGNKVLKMSKSQETIVVYCGDLSIRVLNISMENTVWKTVGFVCPYCLQVFPSHRNLFKEHLNVHLGPDTCRSCKVKYHLNKKRISIVQK